MAQPERVPPQEAYRKSQDGTALIVCAYDSEDKFRSIHLEGAISFKEFKLELPSLSKEQSIIFYCA
ncbi:MAG: ArsR family transcriptional regulator [Deltaproteobacteria bacterium]